MIRFRGLALSISIAAAALLVGVGRPIAQPLQLEAKISLGEVRGQIDHMAIDLVRQRLFVAELGNDTVGIVDLKNEKVIRTMGGLKEPQGVGYLPSTDALYVANAGDGSVRIFSGADYAAAGQIDLGEDADNIRVDSAANQILVGYGNGGLAVIDAKTSPADRGHSTARPSGRFSTQFRKQSGVRQSPQGTHNRSCGSPIREADGELAHRDRQRQFPNGAPSRRRASPHRFPQAREARRLLDRRRRAPGQSGHLRRCRRPLRRSETPPRLCQLWRGVPRCARR